MGDATTIYKECEKGTNSVCMPDSDKACRVCLEKCSGSPQAEQATGVVLERIVMPLMLPYGEASKYQNVPKSVPFSMLDRKMADTVHSQTLERLAERGGCCPSEMLALMTGQNIFRGSVNGVELFKMDNQFAIDEINKLLSA